MRRTGDTYNQPVVVSAPAVEMLLDEGLVSEQPGVPPAHHLAIAWPHVMENRSVCVMQVGMAVTAQHVLATSVFFQTQFPCFRRLRCQRNEPPLHDAIAQDARENPLAPCPRAS